MNPKDLKIQIDEISNVITSFKEKIAWNWIFLYPICLISFLNKFMV
jgi:hypothetical protein